MIQDRLLNCGQLMNLNHPINLHDKQCASAHDSVLGRLERLQDRPYVLQKGGCDICVLSVN